MVKRFGIFLSLAAVLALGACGGGEEKSGGGNEGGTLVGKGDCPDCDPTLSTSAFEQTGMRDCFYQVGDTWRVAWQYFHPQAQHMVSMDDQPGQKAPRRDLGDVYLFDYTVVRVDPVNVALADGTLTRRLYATIAVAQVPPAEAQAEFATATVADQTIARHEPRFEFTMNDLFEPVSETFFNQDYPDGQYIELNAKSRLRTGSSVWPHVVPRVTVGSQGDVIGDSLPLADGELKDVLAEARPAYVADVYKTFRFDEAENEDDSVYWTVGDIWPSYVRTESGEGVLVSQNAAACPVEVTP